MSGSAGAQRTMRAHGRRHAPDVVDSGIAETAESLRTMERFGEVLPFVELELRDDDQGRKALLRGQAAAEDVDANDDGWAGHDGGDGVSSTVPARRGCLKAGRTGTGCGGARGPLTGSPTCLVEWQAVSYGGEHPDRGAAGGPIPRAIALTIDQFLP